MQLASTLDLAAAAPLCAELRAARGKPIEIDASAVDRLGGLCLQVLLAAQRAWRAEGVPFSLINPSQPFADAVRLMAADELTASETLA